VVTLCRTAEHTRLEDDAWRQWGPYLSERQWGTVREDQSLDGNWSVLLLYASGVVRIASCLKPILMMMMMTF